MTAVPARAAGGVRPSPEEVRVLAQEYDLVPVVSELLADCDTPVSAFLRLRPEEGAFLLESVEGGERLARYSFLGGEPLLTITVAGGVAAIRDENGERREPCPDPLAIVERETRRRRVAPAAGVEAPFLGGAIGFLAYEAARSFERVPLAESDELAVPDAWFAIVDTLIVFDHVAHRMILVTHARTGGHDVDAAYDAAVQRIESLRARLRRPLPPPATAPGGDEAGAEGLPADLDRVASMTRAE
ncbi:MAG TPA: anthranilate synthase component I, partial [Candidatus Dormibacteraeota bacterium]|nr:anthranilate synthase component I [Candidatus Dormibacteraeota bacterium]